MLARSKTILAGVALFLTLAACSSSGSPTGGTSNSPRSSAGSSKSNGGSNKPIVIGMPTGQTGQLSFFDVPAKAGAQIAINEINAKGGVLGRKLKLDVKDTATNLSQVASTAISVLNDGADFIIPTMDYNYGGPAASEAQKRGIISIGGAGDPRFGKQGLGDLVYNLLPASQVEGAVAAEYAYNQKKWRSAYVLVQTDIAHPVTVCGGFNYTWKKLGGTVVGSDTFTGNNQSFAPYTARVRAAQSKADFIMMCSIPPAGTTFLKELRSSGIALPIVLDDAYDGPYWLAALPNASDMYHTGTGLPGSDPDATRAHVFDAYKKMTGQTAQVSVAVLMGYSAITALAKAITAAGSTETAAVAKQLNSFANTDLAIGPTTFTPECHISPRTLVVVSVQKGAESLAATIRPDNGLVQPHPC